MVNLNTVLSNMVKAIVDDPAAVSVSESEVNGELILELTVAPDDMGKVIGKHGRIAKALRMVMKAAAASVDRKVVVIDKNGIRYRIRDRLRDLEDILPSYFIRINKSTLANEHRIARFDAVFNGSVDAVFQCGYREYVSRRCFAEIKRRYNGI